MVLVAGLSLAGAEVLVIAERGKESDYAIVMPANPSPSHHYAAVELRDFIAAATGEKLSVITHAAAMPHDVGPRAGRVLLDWAAVDNG